MERRLESDNVKITGGKNLASDNKNIPELDSKRSLTDTESKVSLEDFNKLNQKISDLQEDFKREKSNSLIILGIFASIIAFLSINIQIFQIIKTPLSVIGLVFFIVGSLGLFLLLLIEISKNISDLSFQKIIIFKNQIFWITIILLIVGTFFICLDNINISSILNNYSSH